MNVIQREQFNVLHETQALRSQLMELLTDEDLAFTLPGNPSLGTLCREMGEIQHSYIESFKTFKHDFTYRHDDWTVETQVEPLKIWYEKLDQELETVLRQLTDDDIGKNIIDRGFGMQFPVMVQFHVYRESLLIFYAKVSVYLKALGKPFPTQWRAWIG
jgi:hypothetical protein